MITKSFTVRNLETTILFEGDPTVQWFAEVLGSNAKNPTIKGIANGAITLMFVPECLNRKVEIAFHEASESAEVQKIDEAIQEYGKIALMRLKTKNWIVDTVKQSPKFVKIFVAITVGLFLADRFFAPENDPNRFTEIWKNFSAAGAANALEEFYDTKDEQVMIITNMHPLYESDAIKEIEDKFVDAEGKRQLSFKAMFKYVGRGTFIMKDLIEKDNEPILFDYDDAEEQCELIETKVVSGEMLDGFFPHIGISERSDYAEWTSDSDGMFSDNYLVYVKDAAIPDGSYKENGKVFVDGDDVKLPARCGFKASDFEN